MTKQEMIENLNEDLAGVLGAIIQYLTYEVMPPDRSPRSFRRS